MARRRTNIYLDDVKLRFLRALAEMRGESVAALVREAVDKWLAEEGARAVPEDEWRRRWDAFLERGRERAEAEGWTLEDIEPEVMEVIREVRRERAARRR